ncbi:Smr domain-containing protein [Psilocybe cubensis]|uniref:Smr domain-containing protein n=2 Tax=Psilocybe cubensis TaxID=181762 RepID=A0A8H7Y6U3_PSICU|nr:Smr domain-containing protein [Psilocybe cubensis]KAH9485001.1 Smr domain-containing protein [Psilocybe cubensis]
MDVALSILAGLGLRIFLVPTNTGPTNKLTTAILGLWEGIVLHQVSGRSTSPNLDHVLAYGLRIVMDLLISKDLQRMVMVLLWSALGSVASEAFVPRASLRAALKKDRERVKERRHRHSRSIPTAVPILSTPLPPRIRAYRAPDPDQSSINPLLPENPPPPFSSSISPLERPPTPPSFFLQEDSILSPSPKPVLLQVQQSTEHFVQEALPVRPRSGLASLLDHSPDSGSPLPVPNHLPTPPDTAIPSDGMNDLSNNDSYLDCHKPRFENQLYTIPELSSPEDNTAHPENGDQTSNVSPRSGDQHQNRNNITQQPLPNGPDPIDMPIPVPNYELRSSPNSVVVDWLTSQSSHVNAESLFPNQFATTSAEVQGALPVLLRHQDPLWHIHTPTASNHIIIQENIDERMDCVGNTKVNLQANYESEVDELLTPGARDKLAMETDNEHDADPLLTPKQARLDELEGQLSPLSLNVRSALGSDHAAAATEPAPNVTEDDFQDELQMPGSLSQNPLLQPPLPPSGPLFRRTTSPPPESPPPPSPSTILSDPSDASILSTRIPTRLYQRADQLRQKAREEESVRAQLEEQRKRAESEGRVMDALALKIKVRELDAEAYKLHEKAARRYFVARNTLTKSNEIDVHGLRPREAFDRVERAIIKANEEKRTTVRVIVGKGKHSIDQRPTLKPAVQREMQRLGIKCEVDARNQGVLIVSLPQPRL